MSQKKKHSETFSLGRLQFEGHFKDEEHSLAPAAVREEVVIYSNEEQQAGARAQRGEEAKFGTTFRRCNFLFPSPQKSRGAGQAGLCFWRSHVQKLKSRWQQKMETK